MLLADGNGPTSLTEIATTAATMEATTTATVSPVPYVYDGILPPGEAALRWWVILIALSLLTILILLTRKCCAHCKRE